MTKLIKPAQLTTFAAVAIFSLALSAAAQTLSGTVTNGTTGKPAAGDEVILINLANGMDVAANTKADSAGKFSFKLNDGTGETGKTPAGMSGGVAPHLIRAIHQGVTYHQIAPPGVSTVDVKVYDVSKKVDSLSLTADVLRFQADGSSLQGIRLFAIANTSSPPVTQMNDHNFEFYLPAGAKIEQLQAKAPGGQPISAEAIPQSEKGRFAINFPLRPGETQIQLEFTMPYSGSVKIDPKPLYPAEHFVVIVPKTMHFTPAVASSFKSMQDPTQADTMVQVAQQTHVGQKLGFTVTGTGTISDQPAQAAPGGASPQPEEQSQAAPDNRPGGGLGAPIDAPDPLEKYRWPIIGTFIVLLGIGGWIVTKRQGAVSAASGGSAARATLASGPLVAPITGPGAGAISGSQSRPVVGTPGMETTPVTSSKATVLLEALKEELFQLEVERKQGKIGDADYEKAKAALDQTLERALKRQSLTS